MKKLGFGCARLPLHDKGDQTSIDIEQFCRMVDLFIQSGFTYFDTAYMYHAYRSETAVREALVQRYSRDQFVLADKMPVLFLQSWKDQERIFKEQTEKCGVGYFDVYLLHAITSNTYETACRLESFVFLQELKRNNKARHIGMSYHGDAKLLGEILGLHPELEYVQLQINYLDWESSIVQSRGCYETARKYGRKIIIMEPVKGGNLASLPDDAEKMLKNYNAKCSAASWALRYAASLDGVETVLSGMSDFKQLEDNISCMRDFCPINETEYDILSKVAERIKNEWVIVCTACHYCTVNCPEKIPIPEYFSLYNSFYHLHDRRAGIASSTDSERITYEHYFQHRGKASDCIRCGQCEKICPQHIEVMKWLEKVARSFEGR